MTARDGNKVTNPAEAGSCAVVVTYNPDITALLKLVSQLNKETDFLVIDNGSVAIDELAASIMLSIEASIGRAAENMSTCFSSIRTAVSATYS